MQNYETKRHMIENMGITVKRNTSLRPAYAIFHVLVNVVVHEQR